MTTEHVNDLTSAARVSLNLRVPLRIREYVRAYAAHHGVSMNAAACMVLSHAFEPYELQSGILVRKTDQPANAVEYASAPHNPLYGPFEPTPPITLPSPR